MCVIGYGQYDFCKRYPTILPSYFSIMLAKVIRDTILKLIRNFDDRFYDGNQPTRILFIYTHSYGFSCLVPIIQVLEKSKVVYLRTTTHKPVSLKDLEFANPKEHEMFHRFHIDSKKAIFAKWHLIVDPHPNNFYPKRRALRIGMHHGTGFGAMGSKIGFVQNYDIFLGLSRAERFFLEQLKKGVFENNRAFFAIGNPKADRLIENPNLTKKIRARLGVANRPTILITSHWETVSTLRSLGHYPFEILAESLPDCNVIQTGHPWLWEGRAQSKESKGQLFEKLQQVGERFTNAYFLPHENAEQLLHIGDLLITDHSSIFTSFSLLDRPIIWFENPKLSFAIAEIKSIYREASVSFTEPQELPDICRKFLADPSYKAKGRKRMRETFHANPGAAGEAAADILCRIGSVCSQHSRGWDKILTLSQTPEHLPKNPAE